MARKPKTKEVKVEPIRHTCEFCKRDFSTEKTLIAHACEKKRRWLWKDEKYATMGFRAYQLFYEVSMKSKKVKTQEDFIDSQYYIAFTKFGKHLVDINAIEPIGFVEFLIRTNVRLDDWCLPRPYEIWVRELGRKEHPDKALERNILLMEQWSRETGEEWTDFFRKVNPQLATKWIKTGRLSPWLLFTVGDELIERLSDEQLVLVQDLLDPGFWFKKFDTFEEEVRSIKFNLRSVGV
ncbi:hypothetical protein D3C87_482500 [compost metagenome]